MVYWNGLAIHCYEQNEQNVFVHAFVIPIRSNRN
jgi:hypothetical protein